MTDHPGRIMVVGLVALTFLVSVSGLTGQQRNPSAAGLLQQFKNEKVFWRQFEIAKDIVALHDPGVLKELADGLNHDDRHLRGNVAFVFSGLGDARGLDTIIAILQDRSDRSEGQGIATAPSDGRYQVAQQIRADRYYAAHLLGDLKDARALPILVPLLQDQEVNWIVPWALAEIDDKRADGPLIEALNSKDPSMRVLAIYALQKLGAKEALPRLRGLLGDNEKSRFGELVSVAQAAKAAIATLEVKP
jgi:HEAT repeat protein